MLKFAEKFLYENSADKDLNCYSDNTVVQNFNNFIIAIIANEKIMRFDFFDYVFFPTVAEYAERFQRTLATQEVNNDLRYTITNFNR